MDLTKTITAKDWRGRPFAKTYTSPRSQPVVDALLSQPRREWSIDELAVRAYGRSTGYTRHLISGMIWRLRSKYKLQIQTRYSPTTRRSYIVEEAEDAPATIELRTTGVETRRKGA